jgi:hypothetical protein
MMNCIGRSPENELSSFSTGPAGSRSFGKLTSRQVFDRLTGPDVISLSREYLRLCQLTMGGLAVTCSTGVSAA